MTKLTAPVTRQINLMTDNRLEPRKRDMVAVTLYPAGLIGFRQYGRRKEYRLPLTELYALAMKREAGNQRSERIKNRLAKRGLLATENGGRK